MIELTAVSRSYYDGDRTLEVLRELDWSVREGEAVALMGRSGSGKTTLLNVLGCLDRGYKGSIQIAGTDLSSLNDKALARFRNQTIGMVFQSFHLMDQLTCEENVLLPTWFSTGKKVPRHRAEELLERVGLKDKLHQYPNKLSGGEKQRVAIARALVMRPSLLLCDEPTGNLDEETREEILDLFLELHREGDLTLLIVTHEHRTAEIAERTFLLKQGKLELKADEAPPPDEPPGEEDQAKGDGDEDGEAQESQEAARDQERSSDAED